MEIGDQVYYTGDKENEDGFGEITEIIPASDTDPVTFGVTFEDGHTMKVHGFLFEDPGRRFMRRSEYDANKAAKQTGLREGYLKHQQDLKKGGYAPDGIASPPVDKPR